jgi:uncharacterized membrane protein
MDSGARRVGLKTCLLTAVVVLSNLLGNLSLSWGMKHTPEELSPIGLIKTVFTPWVLLGVGLLILWMLTRLTLLSWADLSFVLPITAIGYALTALVGRFLLAEDVSPLRWTGTLLIMAGTALVGTTYPKTTRDDRGDPS